MSIKILLLSAVLAMSVMIMLKPVCYVLSGIVLVIDNVISAIYDSNMNRIFKIPLYVLIYPIFYVLGMILIIIGFIIGCDVSNKKEDADSL